MQLESPDYRPSSGSLPPLGEATQHIHADLPGCLTVEAVLDIILKDD